MRMVRPRVIKEKYSGGPNFKPISARGGAISIRPEDADRAGNKGAEGGNPQGRAGPALAGHLIAVQAGDHRGGLPGNVHQDGSGGAAVHGPVINSGKHDDGGNRGHMKSRRQQKGDGRHGPEPRQDAHQGPDEDPDKAEQKVARAAGQPGNP